MIFIERTKSKAKWCCPPVDQEKTGAIFHGQNFGTKKINYKGDSSCFEIQDSYYQRGMTHDIKGTMVGIPKSPQYQHRH